MTDKIKKTSLELPLSLWERAKAWSASLQIGFGDLVCRSLEEQLKKLEEREGVEMRVKAKDGSMRTVTVPPPRWIDVVDKDTAGYMKKTTPPPAKENLREPRKGGRDAR
jgi:hypothetical protein